MNTSFEQWMRDPLRSDMFRERVKRARSRTGDDVAFAIELSDLVERSMRVWKSTNPSPQMDFKPAYYHLVAQQPKDSVGIATAAIMQCIATGKTLEGMGGPGYAISADIVDALDMSKSGNQPKIIMNEDVFNKISSFLSEIAGGNSDISNPAIRAQAKAILGEITPVDTPPELAAPVSPSPNP
jgi:hypothetical protein